VNVGIRDAANSSSGAKVLRRQEGYFAARRRVNREYARREN
jgi:hypothetical protein